MNTKEEISLIKDTIIKDTIRTARIEAYQHAARMVRTTWVNIRWYKPKEILDLAAGNLEKYAENLVKNP